MARGEKSPGSDSLMAKDRSLVQSRDVSNLSIQGDKS